MTRISKLALAVTAIGLAAAPAVAGYKLIKANAPITVAKQAMTVTPSVDWNKLGARPGRNAESWTLDGLTLNDVTFYGAIPNDTPLFRDIKKKTAPLPRFSATMLAPDVAQLFESSYRVAIGTSLMSIDSVEPGTFSGHPGFKFTYSFVIQGEEVKRLGEARGAIVNGKLYLVTFEAPKIHYFDRSKDRARQVMDSVKI